MERNRSTVLALALVLVMAVSGAARAAEDLLSALPEKALGFVVLNRLAETDGKIQKLGQQLQFPAPSLLQILKFQSGILEGIDEQRGAMLFFLQVPGDELDVSSILLVPVTDYDKLIAQLQPAKAGDQCSRIQLMGTTYLARKLGTYAAIAETQYQPALESLTGRGAVPAEMQPLAAWINENELSAGLTRQGLDVLMSEAQRKIGEVKDMLGAAGGEAQAATAAFTVYERIFALLKQEGTALAFGLRLEPSGAVRLATRLRAREGGELAALLAAIEAPRGDLLAALPETPYVVAVGTLLPEALLKPLKEWGGEMILASRELQGLTEEQARKLAELSQASLRGVLSVNFLLGAGDDPAAPLLHDMLTTMKVRDSQAFLADYEKQATAASELIGQAHSDRMAKTEVEKVQLDGQAALKVTVTMPQMPAGAGFPLGDVMDKLFGPGGKMVSHVVAADATTIVVCYGNLDLLRRTLAQARSTGPGLSADKLLAETTALLPKGSQLNGYWSLQGTVTLANHVIRLFGLEQQGIQPLPAAPPMPPVGFAVKALPGEVQKEAVLPAEMLKTTAQYVMAVIMAMQNR